jgi:ribose transport system permease protein
MPMAESIASADSGQAPGRPSDAEGGEPLDHQPSRRTALSHFAEAYALVVLAIIAAIVFSVLPATSDTFPTLTNFQAITGSQAVLIVATMAVLVPLICGQFDLSVGANIGLSSVIAGSLLEAGAPLAIAIAAGIASGIAVGVVNGGLVTRAGVNAVIVTLGTATIIHGIVQARTGGQSITEGIPVSLLELGSGQVLDIPKIFIAAIVVAATVYYVLAFLPYGRQLYMLGANRRATELVGLPANRLLFSCFVLGGALAGVAGVLQLARAGSAVPNVGETFTLPAFAAAFLGAAAIKPGRYNVGGAVTAIAFLAIISGGLNLAGAKPYITDFVNGTALITGVALAVYLRRRREV